MGEIGGLNFSEEYTERIGDFYESLVKMAAEMSEEVVEALEEAMEIISMACEKTRGAFEKLADEFAPEHYDDIEWERAGWRDAGLLTAQKAAARAKDFGLRLTIEKAREIRRDRKWRKRIDDRVYLIH